MLTVADAYEAMVSDRPYRRGRSDEDAVLELRRCSGTHFDPRIVDAFIRALDDTATATQHFVRPPAEELGSEEARAVFVAVCDGMFASFRRLGGPRLASNLEQDINSSFVAQQLPFALTAGHLVIEDDGNLSDDVRLEQMRRAMEAIAAFIERTSGASLVGHFYAEAVESLPERMRRHADELGLMSSTD